MLWFQRACAFAALIGFPALAADQIVLTNGDTITGAIIKKDGAKLTIKSEFLGEVSMPWSAVKSIKSDSELSVVLPGGETVKGKLLSSGDQLQVAVGSQTKTAPLSGVSAVRNDAEQHNYERLQHPHFSQLWVGTVDFGLALARGNSRTDTLTTAATAARVTTTPLSLWTSTQSLSSIPISAASRSLIQKGSTPRESVVMRWLSP